MSISNSAFAQPDHWEPTGGPPGASIRALYADGEMVLAGTFVSGIFASTDLGETWTRRGAFLPSETVNGFAKNSLGHLFAATAKGVRRSTDNGETWDLFTGGLSASPHVNAIAVGANDVLLAGTSGGGVFRSLDNGETWNDINSDLPQKLVASIAVGTDGTLYAGTTHGLFVSTNSGGSWFPSEGMQPYAIQSLLLEGDGTMWAVTLNGIFKKSGDSWLHLRIDEGRSILKTLIGDIMIGSVGFVMRTPNGGDTWFDVPPDSEALFIVYALAGSDSTLFAGTDPQGAYRSVDNGATWEPVMNGLDATEVSELAISESGILIAATTAGVFRSLDEGGSWERHLSDVGVESLAILSTDVVLAGTSYDGIYRSMDSGETWSGTDPTLSGVRALSFAEAPNGDLFAGANNGLVYRSVNGGAKWDSVDIAGVNFEIDALGAAANGTVYAGSELGIRRSTDGGTSWENVNSGLPDEPQVYDFLFEENGDILTATQRGIFRSADGGDNWAAAGDVAIEGAKALAGDSEGLLYVAVSGSGVLVSVDDASTWTPITAGLNNLDATSLAIIAGTAKGGSLSAADQIYVGTRGGAVSRAVYVTTSVGDDGPIDARTIRLGANYPNPFQRSTTIPIELARAGRVTLTVFDVLGRQVRREDRQLPAGNNNVELNAGDLALGVYLFKATADGVSVTGRMVKK